MYIKRNNNLQICDDNKIRIKTDRKKEKISESIYGHKSEKNISELRR